MICDKYIPGYYGPKLVSYNDATSSPKHFLGAKDKKFNFLTTWASIPRVKIKGMVLLLYSILILYFVPNCFAVLIQKDTM